MAVLAACGLSWLLRGVPRVRLLDPRLQTALGAAAVVLVAWLAAGMERPRVEAFHRYLRTIEPLRVEAGDWIAHNTPADSRVYVSFGHVASAPGASCTTAAS